MSLGWQRHFLAQALHNPGDCDSYKCEDGKCIPESWLCDGNEDCKGGEDEWCMDVAGESVKIKISSFILILVRHPIGSISPLLEVSWDGPSIEILMHKSC